MTESEVDDKGRLVKVGDEWTPSLQRQVVKRYGQPNDVARTGNQPGPDATSSEIADWERSAAYIGVYGYSIVIVVSQGGKVIKVSDDPSHIMNPSSILDE